jgi:hypothetical protein
MLGVKGEWDDAPTADEIERISGNQIRFNGRGVRLEQLLATTHLGCYEDTRGNYWFGTLDSDRIQVHEHDRWHYLVPKMALDTASGWGGIRYRPLHGCGVQYDSSKIGLLNELEGIAYWVENEAPAGRDPMGPMQEMDFIHQAMIVHRTAAREKGKFNPDKANQILRANVKPIRLHELVFHFEEWAAANEAGDMPQDMVLRMHGLGAVVDARQLGEEWLRQP